MVPVEKAFAVLQLAVPFWPLRTCEVGNVNPVTPNTLTLTESVVGHGSGVQLTDVTEVLPLSQERLNEPEKPNRTDAHDSVRVDPLGIREVG